MDFFNLVENAKLNSIIFNNTRNLPTTLKIQNPECFNLISQNPINHVDYILWKKDVQPNCGMIKESIFSSYVDVNWTKEFWFKGFELNYSLYC